MVALLALSLGAVSMGVIPAFTDDFSRAVNVSLKTLLLLKQENTHDLAVIIILPFLLFLTVSYLAFEKQIYPKLTTRDTLNLGPEPLYPVVSDSCFFFTFYASRLCMLWIPQKVT
jgi:hypothetical protein